MQKCILLLELVEVMVRRSYDDVMRVIFGTPPQHYPFHTTSILSYKCQLTLLALSIGQNIHIKMKKGHVMLKAHPPFNKYHDKVDFYIVVTTCHTEASSYILLVI